MTVSTPRSNLGRHLFGAAALAFGIVALVWHDYHDWDRLRYAAAAAWIFGGAAIQFPRTAKIGAVVLGVVYLVFALLCVPRLVAAPKVYNKLGTLLGSRYYLPQAYRA